MIVRRIQIEELLRPNKVLILYGPRQVGKTTLVHHYLSTAPAFPGGVITQTGDDIPFSNQFSQCDLHFFRSTIPENSLLFIDEAQRIPEIGRGVKLIVDNIPGVSVIVTGSSSFDLLQSAGEALTGRKTVATLYPVSVEETLSPSNRWDLPRYLPDYLRFGMYPAVIAAATYQEKESIVRELAGSYLLKDILDFDKVKGLEKDIRCVAPAGVSGWKSGIYSGGWKRRRYRQEHRRTVSGSAGKILCTVSPGRLLPQSPQGGQ